MKLILRVKEYGETNYGGLLLSIIIIIVVVVTIIIKTENSPHRLMCITTWFPIGGVLGKDWEV